MKKISLSIFTTFLIALSSCVDDDDSSVKPGTQITPNEEELITTVNLLFRDTNGLLVDTFAFNDLDGDGGNPPVIDTIKLKSNSTFLLSLEFLDASDPNDIEDITAEIKAEDDEHLICFEPQNLVGLNIIRTDSDGTYELGLESRWSIPSGAMVSNSKVKISLKHQPNVKDGTCGVGDTDVEIDFPIVILPE